MLTPGDFEAFRLRVEAQSVRQLRRYLDYGRRARRGVGLAELEQWLGRILLDRDGVYGLDDKALAFEIAACEWLARRWGDLSQPTEQVLTLAGPVDKVCLLRLLVAAPSRGRAAALAALYAERYGKQADWVAARAAEVALEPTAAAPPAVAAGPEVAGADDVAPAPGTPPDPPPGEALFLRFLEHLDELAPLSAAADAAADEAALAAAHERESRLQREVAAVTDRAERAVHRMEALQQELAQLKRTVRDEREIGERLRDERSRRIRSEREARDALAELQRLQAEYVKLDGRLRATARADGGAPQVAGLKELAQLARMSPEALLGVPPAASPQDLAQARRRFAAAFHSDRAGQLPGWVGELFDALMAIVNAACDRPRR